MPYKIENLIANVRLLFKTYKTHNKYNKYIMAPKQKQLSGVALLKARIEAQKKLEAEAKLKAEQEEQALINETILAEKQKREEEEEKRELNDLRKKKNIQNKKNEALRMNQDAIRRMQMAGMIMPDGYAFTTNTVTNCNVNTRNNNTNINVNNIVTHNNISNTDLDLSLRSPIVCVLGHVDAGKTSLLDNMRKTNVQGKEVRGITQQIGASELTYETLKSRCNNTRVKIPGIILLDTPGHETFVNLRDRGSALCDFAILIVNIFSGLEKQTIESIKFLTEKKCPFIVALNKIDRLYGWKPTSCDIDIVTNLSQQKIANDDYQNRVQHIVSQFAHEGFNAKLFYEKGDDDYLQLIPISSISGEGVNDLLSFAVSFAETNLYNKLKYKPEVECMILDVKNTNNIGYSIDVILINGTLHVGDNVVVGGLYGAIVTRIKRLTIQQKVNGEYIQHKSVKGSSCVKIFADGLENVMIGSQLYVVNNNENELIEKISNNASSVFSHISKDIGITICSSTLGSLEGIVKYIIDKKIPINYISLGGIQKKNLINVINMKNKHPKYGVILAFDVDVAPDALVEANKNNIKIISSNIIYTLFDKLDQYMKEYDIQKKKENENIAIFPAIIDVINVFRKSNPLIIGCKLLEGQVRLGTPLCLREDLDNVGKVIGIQINNDDVTNVNCGDTFALKIKTFDKQKDINVGDCLVSKLSRESIDAITESFYDDMKQHDWKLLAQLKKEQSI